MVAAAALAIAVPIPAAFAQTDPVAQAHQAAANQLGMLEYCKGKGYVGDDALAAERAAIGRLPPSSASTQAAQAAGAGGAMLAPNGTRTTMADMASAQKSSEADLCKQMGNAVLQSAAMMRSVPQMPTGMPQMPTGMPQMPTGMPSMPGGMPQLGAVPQPPK